MGEIGLEDMKSTEIAVSLYEDETGPKWVFMIAEPVDQEIPALWAKFLARRFWIALRPVSSDPDQLRVIVEDNNSIDDPGSLYHTIIEEGRGHRVAVYEGSWIQTAERLIRKYASPQAAQ